jgi:hypothetical protein
VSGSPPVPSGAPANDLSAAATQTSPFGSVRVGAPVPVGEVPRRGRGATARTPSDRARGSGIVLPLARLCPAIESRAPLRGRCARRRGGRRRRDRCSRGGLRSRSRTSGPRGRSRPRCRRSRGPTRWRRSRRGSERRRTSARSTRVASPKRSRSSGTPTWSRSVAISWKTGVRCCAPWGSSSRPCAVSSASTRSGACSGTPTCLSSSRPRAHVSACRSRRRRRSCPFLLRWLRFPEPQVAWAAARALTLLRRPEPMTALREGKLAHVLPTRAGAFRARGGPARSGGDAAHGVARARGRAGARRDRALRSRGGRGVSSSPPRGGGARRRGRGGAAHAVRPPRRARGGHRARHVEEGDREPADRRDGSLQGRRAVVTARGSRRRSSRSGSRCPRSTRGSPSFACAAACRRAWTSPAGRPGSRRRSRRPSEGSERALAALRRVGDAPSEPEGRQSSSTTISRSTSRRRPIGNDCRAITSKRRSEGSISTVSIAGRTS